MFLPVKKWGLEQSTASQFSGLIYGPSPLYSELICLFPTAESGLCGFPYVRGLGLCSVATSCLTLCNPMDYSLPGPFVCADSPGKNTGVGCHVLLQVQFSSVAQSCPTLCDPMDCSTPGLPVHHQFPEFTQTHVHQVGDAIQPSHPG